MRTLDRHLHGDFATWKDRNRHQSARRGMTLRGTPCVNALYHNVGGDGVKELSIVPRHHPIRIAQARRLKQIRRHVLEMTGALRQWPSCRVDQNILFKPRKAS
jgi:hypothetical protein